jgi:hypothetical protein
MDTVVLVAGTSWYQPLRAMAEEREGRTWTHRTSVALLLADTLTSLAAAAGALAAPPSYLNDRHLLIFGILGGWILSALMTRLLVWSNTNRRNLERLGFIVAKDMLLAVAIPVLFSMTTCGWLSSCKLWANYYGYGAARARVPLDNTAAFEWNNRVLYPALVGTCLGLNLLTYLVLRWLVYRSAFHVLVWSRSAIGEALCSGKGTTGLDIELQHSNLIAVAVPSVSSPSSTSSQSPNSYS